MTGAALLVKRVTWLVTPCLLLAAEGQTAVLVDTDVVHQTIEGFGASSAFFSEYLSDEDAEFLFSKETGIGLSLLRVSIAYDAPVTAELETAKKAQARGARVVAASWTPKPEWKTNRATHALENGQLETQYYPAYADFLADFAEHMRDEGVPLVALTPQNEPDYPAAWDGCVWTVEELVTFIGQHLGPELARRKLDVGILAPDTASFWAARQFFAALLSDPNAKKYLAGLSTHPYGRLQFGTWLTHERQGLPLWQTEFSQEGVGAPADPTMTSALAMARVLHEHLTELSVSAWNYFNLTAVSAHYQNDDKRQNPALIQDGVRFKRAYVLGNFSKFVRPGFKRVKTTPEPAPNVLAVAFKDEGRLVIVAVNGNSKPTNQSFRILGKLGGVFDSAVPWVTSDEYSLAAQPPVSIRGQSFSYNLLPRSVTSFVIDVLAPSGS